MTQNCKRKRFRNVICYASLESKTGTKSVKSVESREPIHVARPLSDDYLSFWCSFCCCCFISFLGTDRSVKLTGRSTLVLNEHLCWNQQTSIVDEVLVTYKLETLVPGNYSSHLRSTVSFSGNVHHFLQVNFSLDEFDFLFQLFLSFWYAFSFSWCC